MKSPMIVTVFISCYSFSGLSRSRLQMAFSLSRSLHLKASDVGSGSTQKKAGSGSVTLLKTLAKCIELRGDSILY